MNCHRPHYSTQTQMERATRRKSSNDEKPNRSSSFDCDSASMDSILGLKTLGDRNLRFDRAEPWRIQDLPAPLKPNCSHTVLELDAMLRRERLVRLLDRQQAWYDSAQQAANAAEQLLLLCEHHQQPWLQSPTHP